MNQKIKRSFEFIGNALIFLAQRFKTNFKISENHRELDTELTDQQAVEFKDLTLS